MGYRHMRLVLFFDLPSVTTADQKAYRWFVKSLKKEGFIMLQESVYVKMAIDKQASDFTLIKLEKIVPAKGSIMTLVITEKQFSSMKILLGEAKSDVITSVSRIVYL